jgi:hypothetical protein
LAPFLVCYPAGIKGRGEYVRLMFEDAGVPYVDAGVEKGKHTQHTGTCNVAVTGKVKAWHGDRPDDEQHISTAVFASILRLGPSC